MSVMRSKTEGCHAHPMQAAPPAKKNIYVRACRHVHSSTWIIPAKRLGKGEENEELWEDIKMPKYVN